MNPPFLFILFQGGFYRPPWGLWSIYIYTYIHAELGINLRRRCRPLYPTTMEDWPLVINRFLSLFLSHFLPFSPLFHSYSYTFALLFSSFFFFFLSFTFLTLPMAESRWSLKRERAKRLKKEETTLVHTHTRAKKKKINK